jgi:hypothetical protein
MLPTFVLVCDRLGAGLAGGHCRGGRGCDGRRVSGQRMKQQLSVELVLFGDVPLPPLSQPEAHVALEAEPERHHWVADAGTDNLKIIAQHIVALHSELRVQIYEIQQTC